MISLPKLACEGLGISPLSKKDTTAPNIVVRETPCKCSFCGGKVEAGDVGLHDPLKGNSTFMDDFSLAQPGQRWACQWCAPLLKAAPMRALMNSVVTTEGVYSVSKIQHRKYFLLNMPEPPWALLICPAKLQHAVWRAIPTIDNNYVQIFHDGNNFTLRGSLFPEIIKTVRELTSMMEKKRSEGRKSAFALKNPFHYLSNKREDALDGILRPLAYEIPEAEEHVRFVEQLSYGEIWALATVLGDIEPEKPSKTILK